MFSTAVTTQTPTEVGTVGGTSWRDSFHNFPKETPTEPRNLLQSYKQR